MKKLFIYMTFFGISFFGMIKPIKAQNPPSLPDKTGTLSLTQTLHFGDFTLKTPSSSGSVMVDYNGTRTASGDVILLNMGNTAQQAIFEFKLCPGRTVTINYSGTTTLTGSNGGSILLHIGPTNIGTSGSTFTSNKGCDDTHLIYVGGTIDVNAISSNPAGLYTGTFSVTFNQE